MNRCSCRCSARLLANNRKSNSESSETDGSTCSKNNTRVSVQLRRGVPGAEAEMWHFQQSYFTRLATVHEPTRILTMPGFGGTANLQSPPLTLTLTLRIPSAVTRRRMSTRGYAIVLEISAATSSSNSRARVSSIGPVNI